MRALAVVALSSLSIAIASSAAAQDLGDRLWGWSHTIIGDDATLWMRREAYAAAVDIALAQADVRRGDEALIQRDFTHTRYDPSGAGSVPTFEPCTLSADRLEANTGLSGERCDASPGIGGVQQDQGCPETVCIQVSVRDVTWADESSRKIIIETLKDHQAVCHDAENYGPNKRADAAAAGCNGAPRHAVKIAIEVKPRLTAPCVALPVSQRSFRIVCKNQQAHLIFLDGTF